MHSDTDCFYSIGYTVYTSRNWYQDVVLRDLLRVFLPYCSDCGYYKVIGDFTDYCADCYWDQQEAYRYRLRSCK